MNNNKHHTANNSEAPNRFGYILHLWNCAGQWRASLENLETGKRFGFENLEQLFAYLMDLVEGKLNKPQRTEQDRIDKPDTGITSCEC
jgi:hypothetical protein